MCARRGRAEADRCRRRRGFSSRECHILRILAAVWLGLPWSTQVFRLDTASVSRLGWERETRVILTWNEDWSRVRAVLGRVM
jgi:hypothetical protein